MAIFEVIKKSWNEYRIHFKNISLIMILLAVIPALILGGVILAVAFNNGLWNNVVSYMSLEESKSTNNFNLDLEGQQAELSEKIWDSFRPVALTALILLVPYWLVNVFAILCLFVIASHSTRQKFRNILKESKSRYWKFVGTFVLFFAVFLLALILSVLIISILSKISIVIGILSILIIFLLIIWVSIKFILTPYFLVYEKRKILDSYSASWKSVRGKWWYIFASVLLFLLIGLIIKILAELILLIIGIPVTSLFAFDTLKEILYSPAFITWTITRQVIEHIISSIVILPLLIFFSKNLYKEIKNK
ncbi:hypothetical protein J4461_02635 [Candidatus Pacearchaeota archaeon]|nr:hypothetical protein [Candidatus Pacearchaeota archaeon]